MLHLYLEQNIKFCATDKRNQLKRINQALTKGQMLNKMGEKKTKIQCRTVVSEVMNLQIIHEKMVNYLISCATLSPMLPDGAFNNTEN
jgi:hypothetical protein